MGNKAKAAQREIATQERRREALELRKQGFTFEAIGFALKCSTSNAHKLVTTAIKAIPREAAHDVVQLELARLDELLAGVWERAKAGNETAIGSVIRIMSRRAMLLGLDKAKALKESEEWSAGDPPFDVAAALK